MNCTKIDFIAQMHGLIDRGGLFESPATRAAVVYPVIIGELADWTTKDYRVPAVIRDNPADVESFMRSRETARKSLTGVAWALLNALEANEREPELKDLIHGMGNEFLLRPEPRMGPSAHDLLRMTENTFSHFGNFGNMARGRSEL